MSQFSRRDFLARSAAGALALGTPGLLAYGAESRPAAMTIAKWSGPKELSPADLKAAAEKLTERAIEGLGGLKRFVTRGSVVWIKPNIGWDRTPEQAATTNPDIVAEVVLMCLEAGASKVKVFDRTCNDARRCYTQSRIAPALAAIKDPRVEVSYIDDRKFRLIEIPGGRLLTKWHVYEEVLGADKFINLPIAKHHSAAVLTIGMKNVMGVIGSNRAVLHKSIHEALPDLNRAVKSHLTVVDATRVLIANGPQGGRLEDVRVLDTVIAGRDIVSVDSVACTLFNKTPREVRYVQLAQDAGLGVADIERIKVKRILA
jgi:uncharacterized protein (DUF362 family)